MYKYLTILLIPTMLLADQLILYKTVGGSQSFDLLSSTVTFPTENTIKVGSTTMELSSISRIEVSALATSISTQHIEEPKDYSASMNDGVLNLTVSKKEPYTVSIYDMLGKRLDVLYNKVYDVGEHKIFINKRRYASGVYQIVIKNDKNHVYLWRF